MEAIVDNTKTDKNTAHSYLATYEAKFAPRKGEIKSVLEIGVEYGGSIKLWHDYFPCAEITGIDIMPLPGFLIGMDRLNLIKKNAYNLDFVKSLEPRKFDIMIDDGPHTLESMKFFIINYLPLLNEKGILAVEDVQDIKWFDALDEIVPKELHKCIEHHDLRENKGLYDDLLYMIDLSKVK